MLRNLFTLFFPLTVLMENFGCKKKAIIHGFTYTYIENKNRKT